MPADMCCMGVGVVVVLIMLWITRVSCILMVDDRVPAEQVLYGCRCGDCPHCVVVNSCVMYFNGG